LLVSLHLASTVPGHVQAICASVHLHQRFRLFPAAHALDFIYPVLSQLVAAERKQHLSAVFI